MVKHVRAAVLASLHALKLKEHFKLRFCALHCEKEEFCSSVVLLNGAERLQVFWRLEIEFSKIFYKLEKYSK